MQVTFTQQGGVGFFPGFQRPVVIDADALDPADAAELLRLVAVLPADAATAAPVADGRRYSIVIVDGTITRHIEAVDPIPDPAVGALVAFLRKQARRVRRTGR